MHVCIYETIRRTLNWPILDLYSVMGARPGPCVIETKGRITASEMRFMRHTAGYTKWDHKRNEDILHELHIEPVFDYIHQYQNNWIQHVHRMPRTRFPTTILNYRP